MGTRSVSEHVNACDSTVTFSGSLVFPFLSYSDSLHLVELRFCRQNVMLTDYPSYHHEKYIRLPRFVLRYRSGRVCFVMSSHRFSDYTLQST